MAIPHPVIQYAALACAAGGYLMLLRAAQSDEDEALQRGEA
jgi:hypothetical protein